ncbi:fructose-bisphosphatase class II [Gottfriedia acidiceleris]|uniref:Fructose-bisphosphatase class II n=1 Tax=Gottfriedia acidiceleris TaxID=371036 RepID=A0ABY4JMD0_9BACI|nr:fructose-bisphosphatase class II [Gottfriedia acidiceleris]UPM53897.1 fructose-bisphosphatase class II [Gottfriedia acidiceleris]
MMQFFATTGFTLGKLLEGVTFLGGDLVETHYIVMRSKMKTVCHINAHHHLGYKQNFILV